MSGRELRLLIALVAILGVGGGSILVYQWFVKPLTEYNKTISKLRFENEDKREEILRIHDDRKWLERARQMSLSPTFDVAQSEYYAFLYPELVNSGLTVDSARPVEMFDVKAAAPGSKEAKPLHRLVTYQIQARGELFQLVYLLDKIKKTPLVHRVKLLTIDRTDTKGGSDRLKINLTIEAMIVSRAEPRVGDPLNPSSTQLQMETLMALRRGPTGLMLLPWTAGPTGPVARKHLDSESGYRVYSLMAYKNIFRGGEPLPEPAAEVDQPDPFDVVSYIRLDTTDPDNKEAWFRNLIFKKPPTRIRAKGGYDVLLVQNEVRTRTYFKCKVLRVDQRDVYIQVAEDVYSIHIGQSLREALMSRPLSEEEMELRSLMSRYDAEWGAAEAKEAAKSKQPGEKKKKGGR
jgi:hypothetical protein